MTNSQAPPKILLVRVNLETGAVTESSLTGRIPDLEMRLFASGADTVEIHNYINNVKNVNYVYEKIEDRAIATLHNNPDRIVAERRLTYNYAGEYTQGGRQYAAKRHRLLSELPTTYHGLL